MPTTDFPRLIEHAFPLKQASLDSVHEKNVRHGHISTLHIWPARRPLAACRAALIATLLPDPGTPEKRQELCEKIGGKVVKKIERKKMPNGQVVEREKEETEGGILHWKRETENAELLEWFREEIRKAYGGRAPKVLDPFAGGGAIPLEAMRLGCEATAIDINPVAWFILKCTLEYPQKLAGKTHPLPGFILDNEEFMEAFYKAHPHLVGRGKKTKRQKRAPGLFDEHGSDRAPEADLAWHVRAWGQWVLDRARRDLAKYYPVYADFEPLGKGHRAYEPQPMKLVPLKEDGTPDIDALNAEFSEEYLADKKNPRWVAKPTVAYLWARTVTCKNCRATIPLLKTRWLCKKARKRVLLTMESNADKAGVVFGVQVSVPEKGGNGAQRREHDRRIGAGTMSRSGAECPCCGTIVSMEAIRMEGQAGRLGSTMTAAVIQGERAKLYREPTEHEIEMAQAACEAIEAVYAEIPFGLPEEPLATKEALGFRVPLYGFDQWQKIFTPRQLLALGNIVRHVRLLDRELEELGRSPEWAEAITMYLACVVDRTANYMSTVCIWEHVAGEVKQTFLRFALPITWDYGEGNPLAPVERFFRGAVSNVGTVLRNHAESFLGAPTPRVVCRSALEPDQDLYDVVVTDPPYYDAIPYSDLMDFFYVWLRRCLCGCSSDVNAAFEDMVAPKWDEQLGDGELIDDPSRHGGDRARSKLVYEQGMSRAFQSFRDVLKPGGRLVIVFAHKQPDAWETLVSAIIRSGFVVDGSWPIATEMRGGVRNFGRASLGSSVWLVCKKRAALARPGWDNKVIDEMRTDIRMKLREFWDAGIRGPDFVWAATGPALEAYSKHPVVKKANDPGQIMTVSEFLTQVRRLVVEFIVGQVLAGEDEADADQADADRLDEPTAYYLLHRNDFGFGEAPAGACILYAVSCGLSDKELAGTWNLIGFTKGRSSEEMEGADGQADAEADVGEGSGSKVKLKTWAQRKGRSMGYEAPSGRPVPLIDRVHRLMHLWRAGDVHKVDEYLDDCGLRRQELFRRLLQSIIELSLPGSDERAILESLSNHIGAKGAAREEARLFATRGEETEDS